MGGSCTGGKFPRVKRKKVAVQNQAELQQESSAPNNEPDQPMVDNQSEDETNPPNQQHVNQNIARKFTFAQLVVATSNFSDTNILGDYTDPFPLRFSKYYKGKLYVNDQIVAVKKLNPDALPRNQPLKMDYFIAEVEKKSLVDHRNVVTLIGYCAEEEEKLLVYEYMPLGSVRYHLHGVGPNSITLSWTARLKIAVGAARGLAYLHHEMNPPIVCRDVKTSNILLVDEDYDVKVSDYGLVKPGMFSYCAPEYAITGQVSMESNMYCFGLVLLELITGTLPYDITKPAGERFLVQMAEAMFKDRSRVRKMMDQRLEGEYPLRGIDQVLDLAARCVEFETNLRPTAAEVVAVLSCL